MKGSVHTRRLSAFGIAALLALFQSSAFALGGMDKANSTAQEIKMGLYALVGVAAGIYMIYLALMAFSEKKSWADFGWGVVHVALAGAAIALASWAWSLFQ